MKQLFLRILLLSLFLSMPIVDAKAQAMVDPRPVAAGIAIGIGLPRIPFTEFRTPISVLGGASFSFRLVERLAVQLSGNALTSFGIGNANVPQNDKLRFNLLYGDFDLMYRFAWSSIGESFAAAGLGLYYLDQN